MTAITITEALASVVTIGKRLEKKREFVTTFLCRQDAIRDPLQIQGGSSQAIQAERQSIADLEKNIIEIRRGIQAANARENVTIGGVTNSIADWLVWRRDVAPTQQNFLRQLRNKIDTVREQAKKQGVQMVPAGQPAAQPTDVIVNIDERKLATEIENLETTLGTLDGALSLKNATTTIEVAA